MIIGKEAKNLSFELLNSVLCQWSLLFYLPQFTNIYYFTLFWIHLDNKRKDFNFKKKKIGDDFQDDKTRLSVLVPEFIYACLECQHFKPSDHIRMY